jgi:AraC-like DNA-binding protein
MEKEYVNKYYMTDVDIYKDSIYCHHALMGDSHVIFHSHKKGQFLYTEGGVVYLKTATKSYFLPARHYIWIPAGVQHSIHPSSPNVIMRNLYFPRFETDTSFFDNINILPDDDVKYSIAKAFKLLLPELSKSELPLALPYPQHSKLKNIVQYLEDHISENINFKTLAEEFEISERTLARLFQKELNMSFIQYYTILRMLTALKLLLDEKLSVNEVALRVGYSSLPTFSNTFFKIVGVRPSDYVKNQKTLL